MNTVVLVAVTLAWLLLPGVLVGAAIGLRGWLLVGVSPALTMGFVSAAGFLSTASGLRWNPVSVALCGLVVVAVLAPVARPWRPRPVGEEPAPDTTDGPTSTAYASRCSAVRWTWWHHAGVAAMLLVAAAMGIRSTYAATSGFEGVNQTWDAFLHAGAIRVIAEGGDPSPAALGAIAAQASTSFFAPDNYHAVAALIYLSTGSASVLVVINVLAAVLPVLLAAGLVGFFRATTGRPAHAVSAALFAAAVAAVPYHMIGYGTLLPYGTALVMLPGVIGLIAVVLRDPGPRLGGALGIAAAGLLGTHPQVAFLAAVIAFLQLGWHVAVRRELGRPLLRSLALSLLVFAVLGASVLRAMQAELGRAEGIDWPAYTNAGGALGDLLLFNAATQYPQWWFVPLLVAGLAAILTPGAGAVLRPFVAAAAVIAGLYILAGAYDTPLSLSLTSLWWNDRHRLAAAFAVLAIAFAAVGAVWIRDRILQPAPVGRALQRAGRAGPAVVLAAGLLGFFLVTKGGYAPTTEASLAEGYGTGPTLSDQERDGLAAVDVIVQAGGGGLVMNDPHDGCGWAYALHGTNVAFPTPLTGPFDWARLGYDRMRLYERFDRLDTDAEIRADADRLGVKWAVLCTGFIRSWQTRAPGLVAVADMRAAQPAWSNGSVQLYRIDTSATAVDPLTS